MTGETQKKSLNLAKYDIDCTYAKLHQSNLMRFYSCDNPRSKEAYHMIDDKKCADCKVRKSKYYNPPVRETGPVATQETIERWLKGE